MIDLSVVSNLSPRNGANTEEKTGQTLAMLGETCAQLSNEFETAPSLRDVARLWLDRALHGVTEVSNPDVLFINVADEDGNLTQPFSLTDALLRWLTQGEAAFESADMVVYSHPGSTDAAHAVPPLSRERILGILRDMAASLPGAYTNSQDEFWAQVAADAQQSGGPRQTRRSFIAHLIGDVLNRELELGVLAGRLDADDQQRLTTVFKDDASDGVFRLSLSAPDMGSASLMNTLVITANEAVPPVLNPQSDIGVVYLYMPATGLEKFSSLAALHAQLLHRLANADERASLINNLLLKDRADVEAQDGADLMPRYTQFSEKLLTLKVLGLQHKQVEDFAWLLDEARNGTEHPDGFVHALRKAQYLSDYHGDLHRRFIALLALTQQQQTPHWLKFADTQARDRYQALESDRSARQAKVDAHFQGLESLQTYAEARLQAYMFERLGHRIDPSRITLNVHDTFATGSGDYRCVYEKTLLAFAIEGLPQSAAAGHTVAVPDDLANPALTFTFVEQMLEDLDVRDTFDRRLQALYALESVQQALVELRNSSLALSAFAANMQGHLSDQGHQLIEACRLNQPVAGQRITPGHVCISAARNRMVDLLVLHHEADSEERYVMYAPGAPVGRDVFEFANWRQLSFEIGGWLKTDHGARYVVDQALPGTQHDLSAWVSLIRNMPSQWHETSATFEAAQAEWAPALLEQVCGKVEHFLDETVRFKQPESPYNTYKHRRGLALLDARIAELDRAFIEHSVLPSYREYARAEGQRVIRKGLEHLGTSAEVDPDTVFVDLENSARQANPDFGPYTQLKDLTSFFMYANSGGDAFHENAVLYSAKGQDLSMLSKEMLKRNLNLDVAGNYEFLLRTELLDPAGSHYLPRRQIYAKRLHFQMYRAAVVELLKGRLSLAQYQWLVYLIVGIDSSTEQPVAQRHSQSTVSTLSFNRRLIEGAFVFKDFATDDPDYELVYTPDAPDGVLFRRSSQIAQSIQVEGMSAYYYQRVKYKDQRVIGTLLANLERGTAVDDEPFQVTIGPEDRVISLEQLFVQMMERMIQDFDEQTTNNLEHGTESAYIFARWTLWIFLLPFPAASIAWGAFNAGLDIYRGTQAYLDGDRAAATVFFFTASVGLASTLDTFVGAVKLAESIKHLAWHSSSKSAKWLAKGAWDRIRLNAKPLLKEAAASAG